MSRARHRPVARLRGVLAAGLLPAVLLAGCTDGGADRAPGAGASATPPATAAPEPAPTATAVPAPEARACYRLDARDATAATTDAEPVSCTGTHTAQTAYVGRLDTVRDGHLLAVDSRQVREQVAAACPARVRAFLGGDGEAQRLSVLRPVWFTPSVAESDEGADWYRCDVVALAGSGALAELPRSLAGVLDSDGASARWRVCATAAPGSSGFRRLPCGEPHRWRAITTVDIPAGRGGAYPGAARARSVGEARCEDDARDAAEDPLDYTWGFTGPDRDQWASGETWGYCWVPDATRG